MHEIRMESDSKSRDKDNEGQKRKKNVVFSEITMATVSKLKRHHSHSGGGSEATLCTLHDNTSPGYGWLLPGWVAEERHMVHGRVYRYYYDPQGNQYKSQTEVVAAWDKAGLIVIDH
ncbi:hypothetical protein Fmac_016989 [Flemingia macrophylla]|uniref:MBD domain-containing protein n=1 Tax=Flemingia macrophylla TaxID=520843 RepID=A0ABD1MJ85_9FABA